MSRLESAGLMRGRLSVRCGVFLPIISRYSEAFNGTNMAPCSRTLGYVGDDHTARPIPRPSEAS